MVFFNCKNFLRIVVDGPLFCRYNRGRLITSYLESDMLTFSNPDQDKHEHRWPFVYFHGQAESKFCLYMTPDICVANQSMAGYKPGLYPCNVDGSPGIVCLAERLGGILCGRIALTCDEAALNHILNPDEWR